MTKVPLDENANVTANTPFGIQDSVYVETQEGGSIFTSSRISDPPGAFDAILSTYQQFTVTAEISSFGVSDIKSRLEWPSGFSLPLNMVAEQNLPSIQGVQNVIWFVNAPKDPIAQTVLRVITRANDSNSGLPVRPDTTAVTVQVVNRADVRLFALISSPVEATDGVVSPSQEFKIDAYLENSGTANILDQFSLLLSLPAGYTTLENMLKSAPVNTMIQWTVSAPNYTTSAQNINVNLPLGGEPKDENTNAATYFQPGTRTTSIPILTMEKSVTLDILPDRSPNAVARGDVGISVLGLELINSEEDFLSNNVVLKGLTIKIQKKDGQTITDPQTVISRIAAVKYHDHQYIFGEVTTFNTGSSIELSYTRPDTIRPAEPDSIDIIVDISPTATVDNFKFVIDSSSSVSIEEVHTANTPIVRTRTGEMGADFRLESDFILLMADNLTESFRNYPNPFGTSERPTTTISYYLKQNSHVEIKIYTLLGELVWSRSYQPSQPQGNQGSHDGDVIWDGRNDKGFKVLNGIYVAYISTDYGDSATNKIALLK